VKPTEEVLRDFEENDLRIIDTYDLIQYTSQEEIPKELSDYLHVEEILDDLENERRGWDPDYV
jgi:thermostable 8-oxoguanine DNA glycosylase